MKIFGYIFLGLTLASCEKELSIDKIQFDKKLVLNCIIAKDSLIQGNLSQSVGLLSVPSLNSLSGSMNIVLKRNGLLLYNDAVILDSGRFSLPYIAKANSEYELQVAYGDFPTIKAMDLVPANSLVVEIDTIVEQSVSYRLKFSLNDPTGAHKYLLQLSSQGKQLVKNDSLDTNIPTDFTSSDKVFLATLRTVILDNSYSLFDDALFEGQKKKFELVIPKDQFTLNSFAPQRIVLRLSCISENMFSYYKSILENTHIYGGPLATGFGQYSNVDQGLGIFSFYTFRQKEIPLR